MTPLWQEQEAWRAWTLSEVNINAKLVSGEAIPAEFKGAAEAARRDWTRYDSAKLMMIMLPDGDWWNGTVTTGKAESRSLYYSNQFGLTVDPPAQNC